MITSADQDDIYLPDDMPPAKWKPMERGNDFRTYGGLEESDGFSIREKKTEETLGPRVVP